MTRPRLTKQRLEYARSQPIYCAVILDLYIEGVITKEQAQTVLGFDIEDGFYPESSYAKIYKDKQSSIGKKKQSSASVSKSKNEGE